MEERLFVYTFWEEYTRYIRPSITKIDILLKSAEYPLDMSCVGQVLDIPRKEVASIMLRAGLDKIDREAFLHIMANGSSRICHLYRKEVEIGSPPTYTASQLSYIYNLDINDVKNACEKLQIKEATVLTMPLIFANIPYLA